MKDFDNAKDQVMESHSCIKSISAKYFKMPTAAYDYMSKLKESGVAINVLLKSKA